MDMSEAQAWAFLITSAGAAVAGAFAAYRAGRVQVQAMSIEKKVDVVHDLTNSRLSRVEDKLSVAVAELKLVREVNVRAESTRVALADEAAAALAMSSPIIVKP